MNLSRKEVLTAGKNELSPSKLTTLNPNAAEFVPSSLKSVSGSRNTAETSLDIASPVSVAVEKSVLDRSKSSISNNSDEEAHQYWSHQLPDDITPDYKVMEDDVSLGLKNFSLSNLSLTDVTDSPHFPVVPGSGFMRKNQTAFSPNHADGKSFMERLKYPVSSHGEDLVSRGFHHLPSKPWDTKTMSHDQIMSNLRDGVPYSGRSRHGFLANMINDQRYSENADINPIEFLAYRFPGFAAESLADVYFANGGDLKLTIKMFNQLELQGDGGLNQHENSKAFSASKFSAMDFPALSTSDGTVPKFSGNKIKQSIGPYSSSEIDDTHFFKPGPSVSSRGTVDFASAVRKMATQDSSIWKYDRNGSANANVGSSKSSPLLASSYNSRPVRGVCGDDRLQSRGSGRTPPAWLETGEAVANMYSELREDAREHARLRNAYLEQARQAYLVGHKALAKELSAKGQLHNAQMKAAHAKAQDSIFRIRNAEIQGSGRRMYGSGRTIDLHGLHVSEALQVLKRELAVFRNEARSSDQRIPVYICVGTGHHTRGLRTPARLPLSVQKYLLEEEGLDFSEPQPGLLQVVIY